MTRRTQQQQAGSRGPKTGSAMPTKQEKKKPFSVDLKNCLSCGETLSKTASRDGKDHCLACAEKKALEIGLNLQNPSIPRCEKCQTDFSVGKGYGGHFLCRDCREDVKTLIASRGHTKEYQRVAATEEYIKDDPQIIFDEDDFEDDY